MPPQFFKDAHSVLNNKFTPRGFSLNLDPKNSKANVSDGTSNIETTDDSLIVPRAVSTASSSGSSSRFFGGYPGGKAKAQTMLNKQAQHADDNSVSCESSTDNIENFIRSPIADSTHTTTSLGDDRSSSRASSVGSDDLLITDVKEISLEAGDGQGIKPQVNLPVQEEEEPQIGASQRYHAAETSADLVMEALVKSQKLCSQFKEKLAHANRKISTQEDEILNHKRSLESSKESIKNFKIHLDVLESRSKDLGVVDEHERTNFKAVKADLDELRGYVDVLKAEASNHKKKVEHLKQIKVSSSYEIERKHKEIELLQQRLDETSGLLSEQKIKSSDLERTLEQCRKEYDDKISVALKEGGRSQEALKKELVVFRQLMESSIGTQLEELKPLFGSQKKEIDTKIDDLQERLSASLNLSEESVSKRLDKSSDTCEKTLSSLKELSNSFKPKLEKIAADQAFVNTICTQILDGYKGLVSEIKNDHTKTVEINSVCKDILNLIETLQENHQNNQSELIELSKLSELNKETQGKLETTKAELHSITKERDTLKSHLEEIKKDSNAAQSTGLKLNLEVEKLTSMLKSKDLNLKQSEQKIQKCKTACDSKLRTQMEIHKLIAEERDKLQSDLESKSKKLLELEKEVEKLQDSDHRKGGIISSMTQEKSQKEAAFARLENELSVLSMEKSRLCDKVDGKQKPSKPVTKHSHPFNSQESINDLELTTSLDTSQKTSTNKNLPSNCKSAGSASSRRHGIVTKYSKRKKLLDDVDTNTLFDDYDFDLDSKEQVSTLPKRYTKRKKTIGTS